MTKLLKLSIFQESIDYYMKIDRCMDQINSENQRFRQFLVREEILRGGL